jgi:hypothetical protein
MPHAMARTQTAIEIALAFMLTLTRLILFPFRS